MEQHMQYHYIQVGKNMKKTLIAILLFSGIALSQVTEEEHQIVKNTLVNMTIRWDQAIVTTEQLNNLTNNLVVDLQAIENPSEALIAVMKKYQIYVEPEVSTVEEP
ncbi:hypothetical protein LCGC14_3092200 [marine sediment metagenome]|uniref:Uncharacterized protein n=1 Tax=marine sediment metagenome TaxID=412755 RepID=A0A0F8Z0I9_9ZZZZ